jgi:hypothetical protein
MTRLEVQEILFRRCGKYMNVVKMSLDLSGDNPDMADPILWALRMLGYSPASVVRVSDAEIGAVESDRVDALFDLAELRLLTTIQGNLTKVSSSVSSQQNLSESWGQLLTAIDGIVRAKRDAVDAMHGRFLVVPLTGAGKRLVSLEAI